MIFDKENVVANKDTEVLILAKDSGKQFTSSGIHLGSGQSLAATLWTDLNFIYIYFYKQYFGILFK